MRESEWGKKGRRGNTRRREAEVDAKVFREMTKKRR
jgi:hypothetical protein